MKELALALFTAVVGYLVAKYQDIRRDKKQRDAVASAMMAECGDISKYLKSLSEESGPIIPSIVFPMPIRDIFNNHVHLFSPKTISAVAIFSGRIDELRNKIERSDKVSPMDETNSPDRIRRLAGVLLTLCAIAMVRLHDEGAIPPTVMAFKDMDDVRAAAGIEPQKALVEGARSGA